MRNLLSFHTNNRHRQAPRTHTDKQAVRTHNGYANRAYSSLVYTDPPEEGQNKIGGFVVWGILRFTLIISRNSSQSYIAKILLGIQIRKGLDCFFLSANVLGCCYASKSIMVHCGSFGFFLLFYYFCVPMEYSNRQIDALKDAVVGTFGRTLDAPTDFDALSSEIQNKTGETISPSTLKRLYGYIKPATAPRPSTLSTLARYAGFSGWSDFCDGCVQIGVSKKQNRHRIWWYYVLAGVGICMLIIFLLRFAGTAPIEPETADKEAEIILDSVPETDNQETGVSSVSVPKSDGRKIAVRSTSVLSTPEPETPEQKVERIKLRCAAFAKERCDSIRNLRSRMDIITYKETVDDFYYPFVFTKLKGLIDKQIANVFPKDDSLATRYRNEVFGLCRDICVELMREIPADELTKAYREKSDT